MNKRHTKRRISALVCTEANPVNKRQVDKRHTERRIFAPVCTEREAIVL